jgi:hypothetical protein
VPFELVPFDRAFTVCFGSDFSMLSGQGGRPKQKSPRDLRRPGWSAILLDYARLRASEVNPKKP